jgi:hypothetical protein
MRGNKNKDCRAERFKILSNKVKGVRHTVKIAGNGLIPYALHLLP